MSEIKFRRDTAFRKQSFVPNSFAHPAKLDAQLCLWITERYTKVGETILDPMAGSGTQMLACGLGRNVVLVELEGKFCKMCRDNWEQVKMRPQLGYEMGNCQIIQGDARNLEGILADKIITSPPFADARSARLDTEEVKLKRNWEGKGGSRFFDARQGDSPNNISNLPYGQIDKIVTSPPYAEAQSGGGIAQKGYQGSKHSPTDLVGKRSYMPDVHGEAEGQIANLPYGQIDKIVTSPPYEEIAKRDRSQEEYEQKKWGNNSPYFQSPGQNAPSKGYRGSEDNIGNLKSQSYLEAMLQVYSQCHNVLKPDGLMILVTKNFIRNKQVIRLDLDTIKLCEQAGFKLAERHYRKLSSQSFWRTIYYQKHPEVEPIDKEDILVFQKPNGDEN